MTKQKRRRRADKGKKRKPYRTTRRYPTEHKTTTPEGRREYMKKYMADLRDEMKNAKKQMAKDAKRMGLKTA